MEQERRTDNLHLRITPTEKERIIEHAKKMNMTVGEYFTFVFNKKRIIICDNFHDLIYQIGQIGNNVNQIAAVANKNRYISAQAVNEVKGMVQQCYQLINNFIAYANEPENDFTQNDSVQNAVILEEIVTSLRILSNHLGKMDDRMEKIESKLGA